MSSQTDVTKDAIRSFRVEVPEAELDRIAPADQRDTLARTGNGSGSLNRQSRTVSLSAGSFTHKACG